jgi:hypothetical protein
MYMGVTRGRIDPARLDDPGHHEVGQDLATAIRRLRAGVSRARVALAVTMMGLAGTFLALLVPGALPQNTAQAAAVPAKPVFAMYYLWWSQKHWKDKLGSSYPYAQSPLPLRATLDANGCDPKSLTSGNHLIDVPKSLDAYDQDNPAVIERDVRTAAKAGIRGFIANWIGTGDPNQTVSSISYSKRLQYLVDAVIKVRKEGVPFKLWISYKASDNVLSDAHISGDLTYLARQYGSSGAFDHSYSKRIMLIWQGSRKYGLSHIKAISNKFRDSFVLLGDENPSTWTADRAKYLDGAMWYWAAQDPWSNPQSFSQVQKMAATVRSGPKNPDGTRKFWFAPLTPGFNTILNRSGSTCVPRTGPSGQSTLKAIYTGNSSSNPDGWTLLTWNEVAENTHVMPLRRWGLRELKVLSGLIGGSL